MRVFVYFNLHRKLWSIKALSGFQAGRVVAHATSVSILGASFRVSEAGRQRVIREQRKNVHAGIVGNLEWFTGEMTDAGMLSTVDMHAHHCEPLAESFPAVTYNPYKGRTFTRKDTGAAVYRAAVVTLCGRDVRAVI